MLKWKIDNIIEIDNRDAIALNSDDEKHIKKCLGQVNSSCVQKQSKVNCKSTSESTWYSSAVSSFMPNQRNR